MWCHFRSLSYWLGDELPKTCPPTFCSPKIVGSDSRHIPYKVLLPKKKLLSLHGDPSLRLSLRVLGLMLASFMRLVHSSQFRLRPLLHNIKFYFCLSTLCNMSKLTAFPWWFSASPSCPAPKPKISLYCLNV